MIERPRGYWKSVWLYLCIVTHFDDPRATSGFTASLIMVLYDMNILDTETIATAQNGTRIVGLKDIFKNNGRDIRFDITSLNLEFRASVIYVVRY